MESHGTTQRTTVNSSAPPPTNDPTDQSYEPKAHKSFKDFNWLCSFNLPSTADAAGVRIIRNLVYYGLYYVHFLWIILFITLIPAREQSLILLVIMTYSTSSYLLVLRTFPNSDVLHRIVDKRAVLSLLVIVTSVLLIVTRAGLHLAATLAGAVPIILVHAVLKKTGPGCEDEHEASVVNAGESVPFSAVSTDLV